MFDEKWAKMIRRSLKRARSLTNYPQDKADDVEQDALVKIMQTWERDVDSSWSRDRIDNWVAYIYRNTLIDHVRATKRRARSGNRGNIDLETLNDDHSALLTHSSEIDLDAIDRKDLIEAIMDFLPRDDWRQVLKCRSRGMTWSMISEELGEEIGVLKWRMYSLKSWMQENLPPKGCPETYLLRRRDG